MRLVNHQQKAQPTNRKNRNGQIHMNTIQNSHGAKNAWQSIDASSNNGDIVAQSNNQGLMI
jgi:hypothetical protein